MDARVPHLQFRMTPNGAASWSVRARTADGRRLGRRSAGGHARASRRPQAGAMATLVVPTLGKLPLVETTRSGWVDLVVAEASKGGRRWRRCCIAPSVVP